MRFRYGLRRQLFLNLGLVILVVWGLLSIVLTRTAYLRYMKERVRYIQALSEQIERIALLKYWGNAGNRGVQVWFGGNEIRRSAILWPVEGVLVLPGGKQKVLFGQPTANILQSIRNWETEGRSFTLRQMRFNGKVLWDRYKRVRLQGREVGVLWLRWDLTAIRGEFFSYQGLLFLSLLLFGFLILFLSMSFLERRLLKPLDRLGQAITLVSFGQKGEGLSKELPRLDEIGDLARVFVEMEGILERQKDERESHIHELAETNDALARAQAELVQREKMATVGHLAAGLAHEVGNPLSAIMGYSDLLKSTKEWGDIEVDLVHRIHKETKRIDRLIRDLLDYARPVTHEEPGHPGRALKEALELLRLQKRFRTMQVESTIPDALPLVVLSESHLVQVLINLLLNAADACEGEGTVRIDVSHLDERVCLTVEDDGPGITDELKDRIFEPFVSSKSPGKGVGLGLALCQRLVTESGGQIEVADSEMGGACFFVNLACVPGGSLYESRSFDQLMAVPPSMFVDANDDDEQDDNV